MWADSRWLDADGDWFEARATAMGILGELDLPYGEPDPQRSHEAIFSVVVDQTNARTRGLPTLFFGDSRIYIHRDLGRVTARLKAVYEDLLRAPTVPTYQVAACRVGGRSGLYLADFCNRTLLREKLSRHGMEFSDSPFVRFTPRGTFECDDWGEFAASFLALTGNPEAPDELYRPARGFHVMSFASLRLGRIAPPEFVRLAEALRKMEAVGATEPAALVDALTSS